MAMVRFIQLGEYGHYCSNFVSKNLPKFLLAHPSFSKDSTIKMAFIESFDDVHAALMRDAQDKVRRFDGLGILSADEWHNDYSLCG